MGAELKHDMLDMRDHFISIHTLEFTYIEGCLYAIPDHRLGRTWQDRFRIRGMWKHSSFDRTEQPIVSIFDVAASTMNGDYDSLFTPFTRNETQLWTCTL